MKLNVNHIQKFVDELPKMPVLKPKEKNNYVTYYEVRMVEFLTSLHRDLPETLVWGYEYNYPGPTIEVNSGERVQIKWMNHLPNRHLLPIDHTIHGQGEQFRTFVQLYMFMVEIRNRRVMVIQKLGLQIILRKQAPILEKKSMNIPIIWKVLHFGIMIMLWGLQD